jgi:hypothetical protein
MLRKVVAVSLAVLLEACGGGGSSTSPSAVVTAPTPAPCTQTLIFEGGGSVPAATLVYQDLSVPAAGRLDVIVDWTFNDSQIGVYVSRSLCTVEQFNAGSCPFLIRSETTAKPRKVSASNVTAGTYYLYVGNFSRTRDESASTQVFLKSETCPPITGGRSIGTAAYGSLEALRSY